jgi:hypothetical protein
MKIGDLCPEGGEAAVVNEEGCPGNVRPSATRVDIVRVGYHQYKHIHVSSFHKRSEERWVEE